MHPIRLAFLCGAMALLAAPSCVLHAQQLASSSAAPAPAALGDSWDHLKALPLHAHMHVAADHGGSTCYFIAADDQNLTCGRHDGSSKGQHVFPRAQVKSVKLTRRVVSTAGGLGIGLLAGGVIGHAAIRPSPGGFDFGLGAARASCAVVGGLAGAVVGGTTDMFRGPVIYSRVAPGS